MTNDEAYEGWIGRTAVDRDGEKIGTISDLYYDDVTGLPEWVTIKTGLLGTRSSFVPLQGADRDGDTLKLPYEKAEVKAAPNIDPDGSLTPEEEKALYDHYGRGAEYEYDDAEVALDREGDGGTAERHDTAAEWDRDRGTAAAEETDDAMTRSEEELEVGTNRREAGRARLRKYVVTEQKTVTVPVEREEVRIEREPITDANVDEATRGPDISEDEHEIVLHEEEAVVDKKTVPKERVRLDTDTVVDQQEVTDEVRKERIELEDADQRRS